MDKTIKTVLIIGGVITVVGGGVLLYKLATKPFDNQNNIDNSGTNVNNENQSSSVIKVGDNLYPKGASVNIRWFPVVNNSTSSTDPNDIIKANHTGLIGKVIEIVDGRNIEGSDGFIWYKVKLATPVTAWRWDYSQTFGTYYTKYTTDTEGYVRFDTVKKG